MHLRERSPIVREENGPRWPFLAWHIADDLCALIGPPGTSNFFHENAARPLQIRMPLIRPAEIRGVIVETTSHWLYADEITRIDLVDDYS